MAVKIPKGRLVHGPFKPICRDCAIYFSITVGECLAILAHRTSEAKYLGSMKPFSEGEPGSLGNRPRQLEYLRIHICPKNPGFPL